MNHFLTALYLAPLLCLLGYLAIVSYQNYQFKNPSASSPLTLSNAIGYVNADDRWHEKLVIACPNEWKSMVVGKVVGALPNSTGVLVVYDYVRGQECVVFAPRVDFSLEKLKELAQMNPYERYNSIAGENHAISIDKPKSGEELLTLKDYLQVAAKMTA